MQTDQAIYQYLTGPEAFRVLTDGMTLSGPYQFLSFPRSIVGMQPWMLQRPEIIPPPASSY